MRAFERPTSVWSDLLPCDYDGEGGILVLTRHPSIEVAGATELLMASSIALASHNARKPEIRVQLRQSSE